MQACGLEDDDIRNGSNSPSILSESGRGSENGALLILNNSVKPFISLKLKALINGYKESSISESIRQEISKKKSETYTNGDTDSSVPNNIDARNTTLRGFKNIFKKDDQDNKIPFLAQVKVLNERTFKNLIRNPSLLKTQYLISILAGVVCGLLFWNLDLSLSGFQNRLGVMFFICSLFGFGCLSSIHLFSAERLIFVKERANRYYSPLAYFCSKVFFV